MRKVNDMPAMPLSRSLFFSICCHLVVLIIFGLSINFSTPIPVLENTNKQDTISAVILGSTIKSNVLPQAAPPKLVPVEKNPVPKKTIDPIEKEVVKIKDEKEVEKINEKKIMEAYKQQQKKLFQEALQKEKKILEKKRQDLFAKNLLADIKKQQTFEKKVNKPKSSFNKTLKEQAEKSLRQTLADETIHVKGQQQRSTHGEVNKYKALILQAISEQWIIPLQANKHLYCELMIHLAPNGVVLDVKITKTSGDPSLDGSARAAVFKASPLPVPTDPSSFETFRHFALKVKPENMVAHDS